MAIRPREIELSVDRPLARSLGAEGGTVRLTARFAVDGGGEGPTSAELQEALDRLRAELDGLRLPSIRADRPLDELVEAYHPRQMELVELLRDEGELTTGEFEALRAHLAPGAPPPATRATPPAGPVGTPAPTAAERPTGARSVAELLERYGIDSLRAAGIVRARREISFDEYMALKRHFQSAPATAPR